MQTMLTTATVASGDAAPAALSALGHPALGHAALVHPALAHRAADFSKLSGRIGRHRGFPSSAVRGAASADRVAFRRERKHLLDREASRSEVFEQSAIGLAKLRLDGTVAFANAAFTRLTGWSRSPESAGEPVGPWPDAGNVSGIGRLLADALARRHPVRSEIRAQRADGRADGRAEKLAVTVSLLTGAHDHAVGFSVAVSETEDRMTREEHERRLDRELDHRTRNLVMMVQSLTRRTAVASSTLEAFLPAFDGRLAALAAAQNLVNRLHGDDVPLRTLLDLAVSQQPERHRARIKLAVPDVRVAEGVATAVAMSFHELASNAVRFGSLSDGYGAVTVEGCLAEAGRRLSVEWREAGGLPIEAPRSIGFGIRLVTTALKPYGGHAELDWQAGGLIVRCSLPVAGPLPASAAGCGPANGPSAEAGRTVSDPPPWQPEPSGSSVCDGWPHCDR